MDKLDNLLEGKKENSKLSKISLNHSSSSFHFLQMLNHKITGVDHAIHTVLKNLIGILNVKKK